MAEQAVLPSRRYADGVARGDWQDDPAQRAVLAELDRLHAALLDPPRQGLFDRLRGKSPDAPQGLYLWGGVGRGKTFLIDLFFDGLPMRNVAAAGRAAASLPSGGGREGDRSRRERWSEGGEGGKRRTHFHRFMREVHAELRAHKGESDPLKTIARQWRRDLRVLVLDEFFVHDIGDAMLLGRLLERLFAEGVALVTTSNIEPSGLFKDGLQRERFLPAIAQLQAHCHVMHMDSATDYRLRALTQSPVYRAPLDAGSEAWLSERWHTLSDACPHDESHLIIDGREIPVRGLAEGHAWFDFAALCEGPRAAGDYIEIATEHHTVLVGGIPVFDGSNDDPARRFVHLIDELYDRHVNLVCTAAADPVSLYRGQKLAHAFERTASRLIEMQSAEYLALEHRP
ncbi:cell division protein ZapE [Marilutibacter alkalisoli]|uniref:AFG1 family ATPase n=1 Tax=Marilutibacter alkalisoli TaxID=2591633 RepID=A0A514BN83_9GAMM|nr:cell division protein ZapE [Lysobacter alkalisoli]QDH68795.1 AFG1 family ATPase [Lysobacter alkalisoli]